MPASSLEPMCMHLSKMTKQKQTLDPHIHRLPEVGSCDARVSRVSAGTGVREGVREGGLSSSSLNILTSPFPYSPPSLDVQ